MKAETARVEKAMKAHEQAMKAERDRMKQDMRAQAEGNKKREQAMLAQVAKAEVNAKRMRMEVDSAKQRAMHAEHASGRGNIFGSIGDAVGSLFGL